MTAPKGQPQCEDCAYFQPIDPQHVGWCHVGKILRYTTCDDGCHQHSAPPVDTEIIDRADEISGD